MVSPGILCMVLGFTIWEGCEGTWTCPDKGNKIGGMGGRNVPQGTTKDHGFIYFEEKETKGWLHSLLSFWKTVGGEGAAVLQYSWIRCVWVSKLHLETFRLDIRNPFFLLRGQSNPVTGFLERWLIPHAYQLRVVSWET